MIVSRCKDIEEFKRLHKECNFSQYAEADEILKNQDCVFCFYDNNKLVAVSYIEDENGQVYLSGFAKRKNYKNVIEAIQWTSNFMHLDDLYANTNVKSAILVLLRCGFKKVGNDKYYRKAF